MVFLEVTADTWLVTGLGFGIVLVLLCLFVYVMKGLGALMQWIEQRLSGKAEVKEVTPKVAPVKAEVAAGGADDMAAIAIALHMFYGIHDMEAPRLTIHAHHSTWNEHTFGINNLDR